MRLILIFFLFLIIIACNNDDKTTMENCDCGNSKLVGAFQPTKVDDDVRKATALIIKTMGTPLKLKEILSVKTQVVAGLNYLIVFSLSDGSEWEGIVYRDLDQNYNVTQAAKPTKYKPCKCD